MKILLIDMNLTPSWVDFLAENGIESIHWSSVGESNAPDYEIMSYAKKHSYIVFTHDLDFGTILAATNADAPSVVQVRTKDTLPETIGKLVCNMLKLYEEDLTLGCLLTIDIHQARVRILPIRSNI
ncbi:MAG: DUF5615 family PIN-like protein [Bacteroidota bacterium]